MTKYSVDQDGAERWESDCRYEMVRWSCMPFVGHRHSHETVECRIVVEYTHGVGADLCLEARSDDSGHFADEWERVETVEVRDYGARHDRQPNKRWLE